MDSGSSPESSPESTALRAAVQALRAPRSPRTHERRPAPTTSVYGRAARAVPDDVRSPAAAADLASRFRSVETSALASGTTLALVVSPRPGPLSPDLATSLAQLVRGGAVAVALGPSMPRQVVGADAHALTVPLRRDDALADEWALVACGPLRRVAFLAQREPGAGDRWSWLVTRDGVAVHRAATAILERVPFLGLRVPLLSS